MRSVIFSKTARVSIFYLSFWNLSLKTLEFIYSSQCTHYVVLTCNAVTGLWRWGTKWLGAKLQSAPSSDVPPPPELRHNTLLAFFNDYETRLLRIYARMTRDISSRISCVLSTSWSRDQCAKHISDRKLQQYNWNI